MSALETSVRGFIIKLAAINLSLLNLSQIVNETKNGLECRTKKKKKLKPRNRNHQKRKKRR